MIVDCAVYKDGRRVPGEFTPDAALRESRGDGGFVWIGLHEPTPDEFDVVRREFDLHELAVEDAIKAHQRPKLETYDDSVLLVLKPARYVDTEEVIELGEILIFLGPGFIVVVRHGQTTGLQEVRHSLESRPEFLALGPSAVLHAIVDRVVDEYAPVVDGLELDIDQVEEVVFSEERTNPAERIYYLKREVLEFRRATAPLLNPLNLLAARAQPQVLDGAVFLPNKGLPLPVFLSDPSSAVFRTRGGLGAAVLLGRYGRRASGARGPVLGSRRIW